MLKIQLVREQRFETKQLYLSVIGGMQCASGVNHATSKCTCFTPPGPEVNPEIVQTQPIDGQKPGTSGLRKTVTEFMGEHYTENFVSATLEAMGGHLKRSTLVVGGDGRFYCAEAALKIIKMCAANGVGNLKP